MDGTVRLGLLIRTFGVFEVVVDGTPVSDAAWPRRKSKALLKVLLTAPGDVFTEDQLIEALLPSSDVLRAVSNIQGRISELRRVLEPDLKRGRDSVFVLRKGQGYCFNVDGPCWVDTVEFQKLLDRGEEQQQAGDHLEGVRSYEEAIRLYRGEFLEADRYEEWALATRENWRDKYTEALAHLADGYAHLGDLHRAAISSRAAFNLRPSSETTLRQLMAYLDAVGDRAEALRVYKIGLDALRSELDVAPSAETEALHDRIRRESPPAEQITRDRRRIAVLPIVSIGHDPEDEYFADGMTEELIHTLAQIRDLKVIAQTSILAYKNSRKPVAQIGRELSVGTLVEGSVRKEDHRARIVVQLIDVEDEAHIWSHEYDRPLEDTFAVQSDIACNVAEALEAELLDVDGLRTVRRRSEDFEAYSLFLKGRHFFKQSGGLSKAITCYEQALEIDPNYALTYAALAEAHCYRAIWSGSLGAFTQADEAARKAVTLLKSLPEAHTALGLVAWLKNRDPQRAEDHFKEAIALDPRDAEARHWYGQLLEQFDRPREAFVQVLKAHEIDPLSPRFNFTLGTMLILERRFDEASGRFAKALEIDPGFVNARIWLGRARQVAWDWEGSEEAYRKAVDADPENPGVHQWLSMILMSVGKLDEALVELERALELAEEPYPRTFDYNQGLGYYFLRQYDLALNHMRDAAEGFTQASWGLAWIHNELGEYGEALIALDRAEETLGGSMFYPRSWQSLWIDCIRGVAYARMGEKEKALAQLARLRKSSDKLCRELCTALLCFALGDADLGFEWLEQAIEKHNGMLMHIKNFPTLDPVRSDPRYQQILQRMGLPS